MSRIMQTAPPTTEINTSRVLKYLLEDHEAGFLNLNSDILGQILFCWEGLSCVLWDIG